MYRRPIFRFIPRIIVGDLRNYEVKNVLIITDEYGDLHYIGYFDPLSQSVIDYHKSKIQ